MLPTAAALSGCAVPAASTTAAAGHATPATTGSPGHDIVVASVSASSGVLGVAAYSPVSRRWNMITPRLPARHPVQAAAMAAAYGRLVLWSLYRGDLLALRP